METTISYSTSDDVVIKSALTTIKSIWLYPKIKTVGKSATVYKNIAAKTSPTPENTIELKAEKGKLTVIHTGNHLLVNRILVDIR